MQVETIDDIINDIADKLGVYGACNAVEIDSEGCENEDIYCCRVGFAMVMKDRIYAAFENEKKLSAVGII